MAQRWFVVIQPGCDMNASDVFTFDNENDECIDYVVRRGGDPDFFVKSMVGDAMPFGERVVLRVGNVWGRD